MENNRAKKEVSDILSDKNDEIFDLSFSADLEKMRSTEKKPAYGFDINIEEMSRVGLHFGHRTSRRHPKMSPYIYGTRNTIHIINLEKTAEKLEEALKFIQSIISENKVLLLVGTKMQIKGLVKSTASACNLPYIENRWLGGTFTNFETIRKRIDYLKDLENKKEAGELEKYTKKEKAKINKRIADMEVKFGGIKNLSRLPDAVFVLDIKKDNLAVREARAKGIKIIGICDTNTDPELVDYPIPANDDAISSVGYILEKVREVVLKAKAETKNPDLKTETQKENPPQGKQTL